MIACEELQCTKVVAGISVNALDAIDCVYRRGVRACAVLATLREGCRETAHTVADAQVVPGAALEIAGNLAKAHGGCSRSMRDWCIHTP